MSAAAQRDKQLNVAVDENPSHRVFIHSSVVERVCHEPKEARDDHQFRPHLRSTRSWSRLILSLFLSSVRALNYIYTVYTRKVIHDLYIYLSLFLYVAYYYYVHAHWSIYLSFPFRHPLLLSFSDLPSLPLSHAPSDRFDEIPRSGAVVATRATCSPSVVMNRAAEEVLASRLPPSSS